MIQGKMDNPETITIPTKDRTKIITTTTTTDPTVATMVAKITKIGTTKETILEITNTTITVIGRETTIQAMDTTTVGAITTTPGGKIPSINITDSKGNDYQQIHYVCFDLRL